MQIYRNNPTTGAATSPLDTIKVAVAGSADWEEKLSEYDGTDGYLNKLWVEAINTTTGDRMALMFSFIRNSGLYIKACEYITLGQAEEAQVGYCDQGYSTGVNHLRYRGGFRGVIEDFVSIDRDFLYTSWAGNYNNHYSVWDNQDKGGDYPEYPNVVSSFFGIVERAHVLSKATVFLTGSFMKVFYNDEWYGASVLTDLNQNQARVNATYPAELYSDGSGVTDSIFYTPVSIHVNIDHVTNDAKMILVGYIGGGLFTTKLIYKPRYLTDLRLKEGDFMALPISYVEGTNVLLLPV